MVSQKNRLNLKVLKDSDEFIKHKEQPQYGDVFIHLNNGLMSTVGDQAHDSDTSIIWYPNSDQIHEMIRRFGYELDQISERSPKGLMRAILSKYDDKAPDGSSPMLDMIECKGWTLREVLLEGLAKIIQHGM